MTRPEVRAEPRRRRFAPWVALTVLVGLLAFVAVLATRDPGSGVSADSPLLGEPAPLIEGSTVDGQPFSLADETGRWVIVNFFATWCVPCRQEHPELVAFTNRQAAEGGDAEVVSVVFDDQPDEVRAFFAEEGGDWPAVTDPDGRIALEYGVAGIPESYLVDPNGFVVSKIVGGITSDGLEQLLARARAGDQGGA
ncbi:MAG: TlpA family protein disulfide reductase [Acidimicrobiales bacterium]|nr:TlpA family protein disulfide reductase [Acidimicrobiales bacterium]